MLGRVLDPSFLRCRKKMGKNVWYWGKCKEKNEMVVMKRFARTG